MRNFEELYADNYSVNNNCLYEIYVSSKGTREKKICNFVPWLVREITVDDGLETKTHITISGIHEDGRILPEVEIPAEELANFTWLSNSWSIDCILEPGKNIKDRLRHAIQTTAHQAERTTVYTVTGWRENNGEWFYLMPGDDQRTVSLPGKMGGYSMERCCDNRDIAAALALLNSGMAPAEIVYPMMAFAFLSGAWKQRCRFGSALCVPKAGGGRYIAEMYVRLHGMAAGDLVERAKSFHLCLEKEF